MFFISISARNGLGQMHSLDSSRIESGWIFVGSAATSRHRLRLRSFNCCEKIGRAKGTYLSHTDRQIYLLAIGSEKEID